MVAVLSDLERYARLTCVAAAELRKCLLLAKARILVGADLESDFMVKCQAKGLHSERLNRLVIALIRITIAPSAVRAAGIYLVK